MNLASQPVNISTKRTTVNIAVIGWIVAAITWITGVSITVDAATMTLLTPVVAVVLGFGYRLSRAITAKWPSMGWVVFGSGKEPAGVQKIEQS